MFAGFFRTVRIIILMIIIAIAAILTWMFRDLFSDQESFLVVIALVCLCYIGWRLLQAWGNPDTAGADDILFTGIAAVLMMLSLFHVEEFVVEPQYIIITFLMMVVIWIFWYTFIGRWSKDIILG